MDASDARIDIDLVVHSLEDFKERYLFPYLRQGGSMEILDHGNQLLLKRGGFTAQVFTRYPGYEGFYDLSCCRKGIPLHHDTETLWEGYTGPMEPFRLLQYDRGEDWFHRTVRRVAKYIDKGFRADPSVFNILSRIAAGESPEHIESLSLTITDYKEFQ